MNTEQAVVTVLAFPAFKNRASNPYNYLLYSGIEAHGAKVKEFSFIECFKLQYDVIHVHWPELYLNSAYYIKALLYSALIVFCLAWARLFGKRVVWTVHNLKPHQVKYSRLNNLYWKMYLKLVDGYLSLSKSNCEIIEEEYPATNHFERAVTMHGLYKGYYKDEISRSDARQLLAIDESKPVCLLMGQLRRYKNIELLIDVFSQSSLADVDLIIVGRSVDSDYSSELKTRANGNSNIRIIEEFIEDDRIQVYLNAADLVVLPFRQIFNSGSALLGVSFGVPTLVPSTPNFMEYQAVVNDLIVCFDDELTADDILKGLAIPKNGNPVDYEALKWETVAGQTLSFYKHVLKK